MKKYSAKIISLIAALFVASSAFAWTPTVEVVRTQTGVAQLKVGGWATPAEMNEINWASFRVWMMLNGQEFDVTAAVVVLLTSGHPAVSLVLNGNFELNIALLQYFGIDPLLYPIGMEVCKLASAGGECASSRESLVKRKPTDFTANATCYPDPTCATASGGFTTFPRVLSDDIGVAGYSVTGIEVILEKATVITGFRAVVTNSTSTGLPNVYPSGNVMLNIHSSLAHLGSSPVQGDVANRINGTVSHGAFGMHPVGPLWTTDFLTLTLATPVTLPAGTYIFSPFAYTALLGVSPMYILTTTTPLGTDYHTESFTSPGIVTALISVGGSFAQRPTLGVDITGY
jgi:hypothetical protein